MRTYLDRERERGRKTARECLEKTKGGKMTTISDTNSVKASRSYSRILRCLNLWIRVFNLFNVMYTQRIIKSKRSYRIRKSETVAWNGWLLILVACTLPTLKVFRIGANGCRSFIYSRVPKQVPTHCSGSASSNNPISRIYPE